MPSSWMYDGFPLKRADANTPGDDYQYVIQSIDAAIRHAFGFPTGVSLAPAFSIDEDGNVEILESLAIGSEVQIDEIVDEIATTGTDADDARLATVSAIRTFSGEFIDAYLQTSDVFVEKAGSTMTGPLVANGGITATTQLALTNVYFGNDPELASGVALVSGGRDLIQESSGVLVGDSSAALLLVGSGTRPTYKGENVALVSDLVDATGLVLAYVPQIGGTFSGTVEFANGLRISSGVNLDMEYNAGAGSFSVLAVGTDLLGDVVLDSAAGIHRFTGDVRIDEALQLDTGGGFVDVLLYDSALVQVGASASGLNLRGSTTRPGYNGGELALLADVTGVYMAGAGIAFNALGGGATEIAIDTNGINASMMPVGNNGEYARLSALGVLVWDGLDIAAGTGMAVSENPTTKQVTISIDNGGVDTAQIANDAITQEKIADASIEYDMIQAIPPAGGFVSGNTYTLAHVEGDPDDLAWVRGGDLLGTAERNPAGTPNGLIRGGTYASPDEEFTGSAGPYVVFPYAYLGDHTLARAVSLEIICDGVTVGSFSAGPVGYAPGAGAEVLMFNEIFIAKETLTVKAYTGLTNYGGYIQGAIHRMN